MLKEAQYNANLVNLIRAKLTEIRTWISATVAPGQYDSILYTLKKEKVPYSVKMLVREIKSEFAPSDTAMKYAAKHRYNYLYRPN